MSRRRLSSTRLWWTAWVSGQQVFVRLQLLVAASNIDAWRKAPEQVQCELVGDRDEGEFGEPSPSEWIVSLDDMRGFVSRRTLQY